MERNLSSLKFGVNVSEFSAGVSRCGACGEEFDTPLFAMVFSDYLVEDYYACPRCLSKVRSVERREQVEADEVEEEEEMADSGELEAEGDMQKDAGAGGDCGHRFGYLKSRPKDTPIPEECLTCDKMIDCML